MLEIKYLIPGDVLKQLILNTEDQVICKVRFIAVTEVSDSFLCLFLEIKLEIF